MFRFQSPYFFLLLIPLALLVVALEFRRRPLGVIFSDVTLLKTLPKTWTQQFGTVVPWLFYLGTALLIVALARPQSGEEEYRIRTEGIALMMCVDRSASMAAVDFTIDGNRVNRLEAVKKTFREFVAGNRDSGGALAGRPDDRIGLLAFGGYVDAYCPLTLDHATLLEMLAQINLPRQPAIRRDQVDRREAGEIVRFSEEEGMTAIGDALAQAVERLKDSGEKSKVIILLSDGEQTFGTLEPLEGAELAETFGIKIHAIGIGSTGLVPVPRQDVFGRQTIVQQYMVMDEETLRRVAETTGGNYFNAKNTQTLERVYAEIDKLEKTVHEGRAYTRYTELYRLPLLFGTALILAHLVLVCTRFRRLP